MNVQRGNGSEMDETKTSHHLLDAHVSSCAADESLLNVNRVLIGHGNEAVRNDTGEDADDLRAR